MALDGTHNSDLALKGIGARYHRISSNKQDFDRQVDAIDRWLASHNVQAVLTFGDTGARDLAEERFQFQAMMEKVTSKEVSWVVIQSIDRLGFKDEYELFYFISLFRQNGVQLWSAVDNVCISHSNDAQSVLNLVAGLTSTKEQLEKSNRIQTKRVTKALAWRISWRHSAIRTRCVVQVSRRADQISLHLGGRRGKYDRA